MSTVTELLKTGIEAEDKKDKAYKALANLSVLCEEEFNTKCRERQQCEEFTLELQSDLVKVQYESHSLDYYNYETEEKSIGDKLGELQEEYDSKNTKLKECLKERFIQEAAEVYEGLIDIEGNLAEVRERISNYEKDDSEIAQNIKNYKYTLKSIYTKELWSAKAKEEELLREKVILTDKLQENKKEQEALAAELKRNISAESDGKNKISNFEKTEAVYKKVYKTFTAVRNPLLNEYDRKDLDTHRISLEEKIKSNGALREKLTKENELLVEERVTLRDKLEAVSGEINENKDALGGKKRDLESYKRESAKILEILAVKNLPPIVAQYKLKLKEQLTTENCKFQESLEMENNKLRECKDTINRYETGLITLPKEVLLSFENKGIRFQYALDWLKNYKGSKEEKEELVNKNPFFPYGILLSSKDTELLKSESLEVYASIPVPIINLSDLNKELKVKKNNDVLTFENAEFLLSFNYLLLDENERIEIIKGLKQKAESLKEEAKKIEAAMDRNKGYAVILEQYSFNGDEDENLQRELEKLEAAIETLEKSLVEYKAAEEKNEQRRENVIKELHNLEKENIALSEQKNKFSNFLAEHEEFKKNSQDLYDIKKLIGELTKKELKMKDLYNEILDTLSGLNSALKDIGNTIKEVSAKLELYKDVEEGALQEGERNIIESKLEACEKQLDADIRRDKEAEKDLLQRRDREQNKLNRIAKEGSLFQEYKRISFSEHRLEELKESIRTLETAAEILKNETIQLQIKLNRAIDNKQRELKEIEKLGFNEPIAKEAIKDLNFKGRQKKIKQDLAENDAIIKGYNSDIDKLKGMRQQLENFKSYSAEGAEEKFDFTNLEAVRKILVEKINSFEALKKSVYDIEVKITREINAVHEKYRDKNRFIKERLFDYMNKERKIYNHGDVESLLEVVSRKISLLELELSHVKSEEEVVINEIVSYAEHLLQELKTIDRKSNIKHLEKTQKLLEISIPEDTEKETLKEYIKSKVSYYGSLEEDYAGILEADVKSAELLSKLIGNINRIRVDIKKIEKTGLIRKSWKEALSQNSGGEKFVSMFILLSSLMSYMRKRETDIDNREDKKILIMDNPFAKTNAEHLLEPMFQIAEKYNIQLLCFSGIGGSSVYNRFDKIYVAKVVEDKFRNKENVSFKAGTEETLELTDFTISREQVSLF